MSDATMGESMMGDDAGQPDQANLGSASAGRQLSARRESLGWTVEQVASQLNLAPRQVVALETDNFSALPGMAVARGFLRAYAKLLKLDAVPLLATIAQNGTGPGDPLPLRHPLSASFSESRLPKMGKAGPSKKGLPVILISLLLIGGVVAVTQVAAIPDAFSAISTKVKALLSFGNGQSDTVAVATDSSSTSEVGPDGVIRPGGLKIDSAIPGVARDTAGNPNVDSANAASRSAPTPGATAPSVMPKSGADTASVGTSTAPVTAAPISVPAVEPVAAGAANALVLKLREDSWVEIKGPNNKVLISRLVKAGSTETFEIAEPVSLTIGNAAAVDGTFRGKAMDFKSATKTNVVKMTLK